MKTFKDSQLSVIRYLRSGRAGSSFSKEGQISLSLPLLPTLLERYRGIPRPTRRNRLSSVPLVIPGPSCYVLNTSTGGGGPGGGVQEAHARATSAESSQVGGATV